MMALVGFHCSREQGSCRRLKLARHAQPMQ
jgi:hypothetical protein